MTVRNYSLHDTGRSLVTIDLGSERKVVLRQELESSDTAADVIGAFTVNRAQWRKLRATTRVATKYYGDPHTVAAGNRRSAAENHLFDRDKQGALPSFYARVSASLARDLRRVLDIIRWRYSVGTTTNQISIRHSLYSYDSKSWLELPPRYSVSLQTLERPNLRTQEIRRLFLQNDSPPFAYQLLGEAKDNRERNPNAALVLAVAAAEVGTKTLIAEVIPEAGWLAVNIPSPPLRTILKKFIPQLPARARIRGKPPDPSTRLANAIHSAVEKRNAIVHRGETEISNADVNSCLVAVEDLLRLFDLRRGLSWAEASLSSETRTDF